MAIDTRNPISVMQVARAFGAVEGSVHLTKPTSGGFVMPLFFASSRRYSVRRRCASASDRLALESIPSLEGALEGGAAVRVAGDVAVGIEGVAEGGVHPEVSATLAPKRIVTVDAAGRCCIGHPSLKGVMSGGLFIC